MAYFIFNKDSDNKEGVLYKIAANQTDLNNLNINKDLYKIIEVTDLNFNDVRLFKKTIISYNGETINYRNSSDENINVTKLKDLEILHFSNIRQINSFLESNQNHPDFKKWNEAIAKDKITWTQISNLKEWEEPIAKQYGVQQIPTTFVLDASGTIIAKDLRGEELKAKVLELLK